MSKRMTNHHIIPRSRDGKNTKENLIQKHKSVHQAYHTLFSNSLPEEAVKILIQDWWYKDPQLADKKLYQLIIMIAEMCGDYIQKQKEAGFRAGAGI